MEFRKRVLLLASAASMIDQFNIANLQLLLDMGYEVHVACNFKEGNTCDRIQIKKLCQKMQLMQVNSHQWDCPRRPIPFQTCIRAYVQLLQLLDTYPFVWIHCQSPIGGALARAAAHRKGVRVLYTVHGFHFYHGAPIKNWILYYTAEKLLAHWTDILVTINTEDEQFARRHLRAGRIETISGVGIDTMRFHNQLTLEEREEEKKAFCLKFSIPNHAVILLSVGELSLRKNHRVVFNVLARMKRNDLYYIVCGQGELWAELTELADELGIKPYIRMTGFLSDVRSLYQNADIFVFPSIQEGLPVALMEAMASGLPCVVSDIRGNRELIDRRGGYLFSLSKPEQLKKAVLKLLDSPLRRSAFGRYNEKKIERYRLELVQKDMNHIYQRMDAEVRNAFHYDNRYQEHLPEISVVMPVYQAEGRRELADAIVSVCRQTLKDWELLICDDGSTDRTWDTLQQLAKIDNRIRLFRHYKNHGAGEARNTCIRAARGRYIAVMDSDDVSAPDRLRIQLDFLKRHPAYAFAGCRGEFFIRTIGDDGTYYRYCAKPEAKDFLVSLPFVHASILFRKEALVKVGGYDRSAAVIRVEDYDLLMRMYVKGLRGANIGKVLYFIRRDDRQYRRRKYRYRFHEVYVKYHRFQELGLMPSGYLYAVKPLFAGLFPARLITWLQQYYY